MANPFVHIELNTADVGPAKAFYRKMFDWKLKDEKMGPGMTYTMLDAGKEPGGGMQKKPMAESPNMWLPYVQVDDVKKSIAKAEKNGAKILVPYMEIGPNGSLGIFLDPAGAALGVWAQAAKPAKAAKSAPAKKPAASAKKKK